MPMLFLSSSFEFLWFLYILIYHVRKCRCQMSCLQANNRNITLILFLQDTVKISLDEKELHNL